MSALAAEEKTFVFMFAYVYKAIVRSHRSRAEGRMGDNVYCLIAGAGWKSLAECAYMRLSRMYTR